MSQLARAFGVVAVALALTAWSLLRFQRSPGPVLRLAGSFGFLIVGLAHLCESLRLFPVMGWGQARSAGHYLDLSGALLGIVLFPLGLVLAVASAKRRASN